MTAPASARHQQHVEELCAAAVRAVSGDPLLHFRARRLHRGGRPYPASAPHLRPSLEDDDFGSFRGAADGLALRRRYSDPALHQRLRPHEDVPGMLFDMLEQFRVESLADRSTAGIVANLRHRHVTWSAAFHRSGLTETASGILLYTLAQICRSRVTGEPVVEDTEDLLEATRFGLVPQIGEHLAALPRCRTDQASYAVPAREIAHHVARLLAAPSAEDDGEDETATGQREAFSLFIGEMDAGDVLTSPDPGDSTVPGEAPGGYQVFTTAHDRVEDATSLVRPTLLSELRERLDDRVARQAVNVPRLALELQALLADPVEAGWDTDREQGRVDGRRLARLISSPGERHLFREERITPAADALVTFLLDCSGSMRRHHETLALVLDVLVRALDLASVSTEVLGFTTGAWNGGRALKDWKRAGRPPHPGRLNEVLHLVHKSADVSWRRARRGIAALLKDELYREGVDGEAVAWACARMRQRPEHRRILVVVSDGSPMDSATNLANDAHYLDHHLRQVVGDIDGAGDIRVCGVGVGLDLSPFYPESIALDLESSTGNEVFREVVGLLAGRHRR